MRDDCNCCRWASAVAPLYIETPQLQQSTRALTTFVLENGEFNPKGEDEEVPTRKYM